MAPTIAGTSTQPSWRPGQLPPTTAAPVMTAYDVATDERVELSGATLANWVAKAANLLALDEGLEPGDRLRLALPPSWPLAVWCQAAWVVGATVELGHAPGTPPALSVVAPGVEVGDPGVARLVCDVRLLSRPDARGSAEAEESAARLRSQPDALVLPAPGLSDDAVALVDGTSQLTAQEATQRGRDLAEGLGLRRGDRLLLDAAAAPAGVEAALVVAVLPGTAGVPVVLVAGSRPGDLDAVEGVALESAIERIGAQEGTAARLALRSLGQ